MKNKKILIISLFVFVETAFLFAILFSPKYIDELCFSSVVAAFAFSFFWIKNQKFAWLTILALLFTVFSDFCLEIISPMKQSLAMSFFLVVQLLYFVNILLLTKSKIINIIHSIIRAVLSILILIITAAILKDKTDYLSMVSMVYYVNIILNVIFAFIIFKTNPLLAIGLLLFLCCDTLVGLGVAAGSYLSIPADSFIYNLLHPPFNLIWTFYVPAQTCLSLSISKKL